MITVTTMDMRKHVGDILNRVALRGDEYLVQRKGKSLAVLMPVEKAESIRRAARLQLTDLLNRPNTVKTDAEAMSIANEARRAVRKQKTPGDFMPTLRVVLDANVIISALIRPDSVPGRILCAAVEEVTVQLLTSPSLLDELRAVLDYPRLQRYLKLSNRDKDAFIIQLEQIADSVNIEDYPPTGTCRDPDDEPYIQTALAGRADYIVSGDDDLLTLGSAEHIPIVRPSDFDRLMRATQQLEDPPI